MRHYEVMVILDAGLEEDAIRATVDRATRALAERGADVGRVDRWGRRRFAYEVHHRSEGYYVLIDAKADPEAVAELDRMLGLADEVVRHKVIRLPEGAGAGGPKRAEAASQDGGVTAAEANENGAK